MALTDRSYNAAAVALHWLIAVLIIFQIAYTWFVYGPIPDHSPAQAVALAFHKSVGLTILVLSLARLGIRLGWRPTPLPASIPGWERTLARISHALFYVLIIGIPLTGWAMASLRPRPIGFWGLFEWPHLPGLSDFPKETRHEVGESLEFVHTKVLVLSTVALLVLHIAGALKNQVSGAPVLWRMLPFLRVRRA